MSEPLLPSLKTVKRKYRTGTTIGRLVRHISEHKNARKILAGNLAIIFILVAFSPTKVVSAQGSITDESIIEAQNTLITQKSIQYPLDNIKINQGYSFFHPAIDLGGPIGTPVKPIKAGVVSFAGYTNDGYGNLVVINHSEGLESYYAHLSKIEVGVNQRVTTNIEIGKIGETGHATGPHLHLEIYLNGVHLNPLTVLSR